MKEIVRLLERIEELSDYDHNQSAEDMQTSLEEINELIKNWKKNL